MKVIQFCFIAIIFLSGCSREKEVLLNKETLPQKLVIQSFISPQDSVINVAVRFSEALTRIIPPNQGYNDLVEDAVVTIFGNGNQHYLLTFKKNVGYVSLPNELPIMADSTYFLSVTTPDGYHAESTCRIPLEKVDSSSILIQSLNDGAFDISWNNVGAGNHYYCVINNIMYIEANHPLQIQNSNRWYGISNNNFGGSIFLRNVRISTNSTLNPGYKADLWVCNTDFNFYEFTRTLLQQDKDNQNPFAEPMPVYSNIKNGLGVFAALNKTIIYP